MNILFVCDPLASFHIEKDSTFTMMREAQKRGHAVWACGTHELAWQSGQQLGRVGELRDHRRLDEARHLDALETRGDEQLDQAQLRLQRVDALQALQAVARPDLEQLDAGGQGRLPRAGCHTTPCSRSAATCSGV